MLTKKSADFQFYPRALLVIMRSLKLGRRGLQSMNQMRSRFQVIRSTLAYKGVT